MTDVAVVLSLQLASALLTLGFGLLGLGISRRAGRNRDRALAAWEPTAFWFTLVGAVGVVHAVFCIAVIRAPQASALHRMYFAWSHASNFGRAFAGAAYAVVLAALLAGARRWSLRLAARSLPLFVAALAVGTVAGGLLRDRSTQAQMTRLGILAGITVLLLLPGLLMAVVNDGLDQLLWFALVAYTLKETLQMTLYAIIAWWSSNQDGTVLRTFYLLNTLALATMVLLAWRRLRAAAAGRHVPALFEHIHARRSSPA